jgi:hypothetical protein
MSGDINISGGIQAGAAIVGGSGNTVESGTLNVHVDPAGQITQLRALLADLERLTGQDGVPPQVQASATAAVAEAANATPDTGRLRMLVNAVRSGVGKAGPVAQAALNVINIINGIENIIH